MFCAASIALDNSKKREALTRRQPAEARNVLLGPRQPNAIPRQSSWSR
jgi:hypothetical protein